MRKSLRVDMLVRVTKAKQARSGLRVNRNVLFSVLALGPIFVSLMNNFELFSSLLLSQIVGICLFVSVFVALLISYRELLRNLRLGSLTVMAGFGFWYALPTIRNSIDIGSLLSNLLMSTTTVLDLARSLLCISLFWGSLLIVISCRRSNPFELHKSIIGKTAHGFIAIPCVVISLVCIFSLLYLSEGPEKLISYIQLSRTIGKMWDAAQNLGTSMSFAGDISLFGLCCVSGILFLEVIHTKFSLIWRGLLLFIAGSNFIILYFVTGTRLLSLISLAPALYYATIRGFRRSKRVGFLLRGILTVVFVYGILNFQLFYRGNPTGGFDVTGILIPESGSENDYMVENTLVVSLVPSQHDYFRESILMQFVVSPIPRFLWPSKPINEYGPFYALWRWGVDVREIGGSVFPGVVGQFYMNWGLIGPVIAGIVFAFLARGMDKMAGVQWRGVDVLRFVFVSMVCVWMFGSFRNLAPGYLYPSLFTLVFALSLRVARSATHPRKEVRMGCYEARQNLFSDVPRQ